MLWLLFKGAKFLAGHVACQVSQVASQLAGNQRREDESQGQKAAGAKCAMARETNHFTQQN